MSELFRPSSAPRLHIARACSCDGTGFTRPYRKKGNDGHGYNYVDRCPGYTEYFRTHMLESRPDEQEGQCKAAIERHKTVWTKAQSKKPTRHQSDL
jgi:hypothetical protein